MAGSEQELQQGEEEEEKEAKLWTFKTIFCIRYNFAGRGRGGGGRKLYLDPIFIGAIPISAPDKLLEFQRIRWM